MDPLPAPPAAGPDETLRYGPDPDQVVDLYRGGSSVGVVLIHGGFWKPAYDRTHLRAMADALRTDGLSVALIEYRRPLRDRWAALHTDVLAAVDAALPHLPRPVVVAGHSAGGHLSVWVAGRRSFARAVSLAGVVDLRAADADHLGDGAVRDLLGDPEDHPDRWADADPMPQRAGCPVVLVHGLQDRQVPIDQSRSYAAAHDAVLLEQSDCDHWPLITPGTASFAVVRQALIAP